MIALDTTVALPLLLQNHDQHASVVRWLDGRPCALAGHAAIETYSVLTRLPPATRLDPHDAARLMGQRLAPPVWFEAEQNERIPALFAELGVTGGAVYDGLVGLAARAHGCALATFDRRAGGTYQLLGVDVLTPG